MDLVELPGQGRRYSSERGQLDLWNPHRALLVLRIGGTGAAAFAAPIIDQFHRMLAAVEPLRLFFDLEPMEGYESALRTELTSAILARRKRLASFDVLARPGIVSMGVSVANLALGGLITSHGTRPSFDAKLAASLEELRVRSFAPSMLVVK